MAGWDGNGNFVMPYSMVQQAGANVKILSTVQDTQWNAVAAGLMNCMTLDSQTKPKADVDIATHKLINVSAPTLATDAANKSYVDGQLSALTGKEWLAESLGVAWVSTTSFSVAGVDKTATYHAGRRVQIVHNTGATTSYGTVVSSSFAVNTTVVVAMDGGVALISTVMAVSYGLLSYIHPSYLDPRSLVSLQLSTSQSYASNAIAIAPFDLVLSDTLSEYNAGTHIFTAQHPGLYFAGMGLSWENGAAAATSISGNIYILKNATQVAVKYLNPPQTTLPTYTQNFGPSIELSAFIVLVAGDTIKLEMDISGPNPLWLMGNNSTPGASTGYILRIA